MYQEVWVTIPKEGGIMRINEKKITRDLQHGTRSTNQTCISQGDVSALNGDI